MTTRALILALALLLLPLPAAAATYFNSAEPGCSGSDPNVLLCDDFEDGSWYVTTQDYTSAPNDGWSGTIYANPITPPNAAFCGGVGVAGTPCTATHGVKDGSAGGRNMAKHALALMTDEVYVRFYTRISSGYFFGAEKVLTFNRTFADGIWFGNLHINCGNEGTTGTLQWQVPGGFPGGCVSQNQGNALLLTGNDHWYFIEVHVKLDTVGQNNGTLRLWLNDCGTTGVCTGTPTLRTSRTDLKFRQSSNTEMLGNLWWENWANPGSIGERYLDQIKVSRVGPIGFMGGVTNQAPSPALNVRFQ